MSRNDKNVILSVKVPSFEPFERKLNQDPAAQPVDRYSGGSPYGLAGIKRLARIYP
jgi:hypothetical protein